MSNFSRALFTDPIHTSEDREKSTIVITPQSDAIRSACSLRCKYPALGQTSSDCTGSHVLLGHPSLLLPAASHAPPTQQIGQL